MASGFFGGYVPSSYYQGGTTQWAVLEEGVAPQISEEERLWREHAQGCLPCRGSEGRAKCSACGVVRSHSYPGKNFCYGCGHTVCDRHSLWPNRKHLPSDHGRAENAQSRFRDQRDRKEYHRLYMREWKARRRAMLAS